MEERKVRACLCRSELRLGAKSSVAFKSRYGPSDISLARPPDNCLASHCEYPTEEIIRCQPFPELVSEELCEDGDELRDMNFGGDKT